LVIAELSDKQQTKSYEWSVEVITPRSFFCDAKYQMRRCSMSVTRPASAA
jgi:hypothetical protein